MVWYPEIENCAPRDNLVTLVLLLAAEGDVLPGGEVLRLRRGQRRRDQLGERVHARLQEDRQDPKSPYNRTLEPKLDNIFY